MEGTGTMNERTDSMREIDVATKTQHTMPMTDGAGMGAGRTDSQEWTGDTEDDLQGIFSVQDSMCHNFGDDDYDFEDEGMWAV